jgi:PAS domain S-box-containing protein
MAIPLNILMVEDLADDAALLVDELKNAGFDPKWTRVEVEKDYLANLGTQLDIIFSDFSLPRFSTKRALELLQKSGLEIPFIIVSGTIGEERAVESLKSGATDYVLKDHIERLGPVVQRALREARERAERSSAEEKLRESERRFREMLENVGLIALTLDKRGRVKFCNDYLLHTTGWKREEVIGADWFEKFIPGTAPDVKKVFFETVETGKIPTHYENPIKTRQGDLREIVWNNTILRDATGNISGIASIGEDVTER